MEATSELRKPLGVRVLALIAIARGDVDQVAVALGMLPWKVRQIAEGMADPTLGEIGRIANGCGETVELFMEQLLREAAVGSTVTPTQHPQRPREAVRGRP